MNNLSIIIPAYKPDFLSQTLHSIALQTNKDFHLYIGDDASPHNIEDIVNEYIDKIPLTYVRFKENLGLKHLTRQWDRCIALSKKEKYIWLFSDDDLIPADAVNNFYYAISNNPNFDIYRFNLQLINQFNDIVQKPTNHKSFESVEEYLRKRFNGQIHSAISEYIFTRKILEDVGGFPDFPLAYGSDDAAILLMGASRGIYTIPGEPVSWRNSGINISSSKSNNKTKYKAILLYYKWLKANSNIISFSNASFLTGIISQTRILRISIFTYLLNYPVILQILGYRNSIYVAYIVLKINVKHIVQQVKNKGTT